MATKKMKRKRRTSKQATHSPATAKKRAPRRGKGRRYTPAERAKILTAASREGLSGPAAAKKFGISTLTFYNWRKKAGKARKPRSVERPAKLGTGVTVQLRSQIRDTLRAMIPDIVREEIRTAVTGLFGKRPRGRR